MTDDKTVTDIRGRCDDAQNGYAAMNNQVYFRDVSKLLRDRDELLGKLHSEPELLERCERQEAAIAAQLGERDKAREQVVVERARAKCLQDQLDALEEKCAALELEARDEAVAEASRAANAKSVGDSLMTAAEEDVIANGLPSATSVVQLADQEEAA